MHRLPHLGLSNSATGPVSSCRNGIWGLLQALTGPQMRFPFPVFLQGPRVKGTPQEEAGRERRCRKWPAGLNWGHANKMQIPPSSHFPSSPRHPHPAVKHGVISLRNTELQRTRGGVGAGGGGATKGRINFCFLMQILWPVIEGSEQDQFSSLCKFQAEGV